jgi:hypothetical protein
MAVSALEVTEEALAYALVTDKNGLEKLLKRNGVVVGNNPSDKEVTIAILMASAKSTNFKNELATFLTGKVKEAGETLSFVGSSLDFGFTGIDDFEFTGGGEEFYNIFGLGKKKDPAAAAAAAQASAAKRTAAAQAAAAKKQGRITTDNPQGKTGVGRLLASIGKSLSNEDTINAGIQIGLQKISSRTQSSANNINAQALALQEKADDLKKNADLPPSEGTSMTTYIIIGAGVLVAITAIYLIVKAKKTN